jgi:hypothetical protein
MASADDLINSANAKVTDYASNAGNAANAAVAKALSVAATNILLPTAYPLNWSATMKPGTVAVGSAPGMISEIYETPGQVGAAPDILTIMEDAYAYADGASKAKMDAAIYAFLTAYCPGYAATMTSLQAALVDGINNNPITATQKAQLLTELGNGLDSDRKAAQRKVLMSPANGHETILFQQPRMDAIDAAYTDNLANTRVKIESTLIQIGVEFKKFCLNLMNEYTNSARQAVLQYAALITQLLDFNVRYSIAAGEGASRGFDAEVKGNAALMAWAQTKLEANIKRMMADLDRYKTDLEAKIESKKLEYMGANVELEQKKLGFTGELQTLMREADLNMKAAELGVGALNMMAAMWGEVAQSAASGVNAIASRTVQE